MGVAKLAGVAFRNVTKLGKFARRSWIAEHPMLSTAVRRDSKYEAAVVALSMLMGNSRPMPDAASTQKPRRPDDGNATEELTI